MKVLWLINIMLPRIARNMGKVTSHVGGGWLTGISNALLQDDSYELVVCMPDKTCETYEVNQVEHNLVSCFFSEKNYKAYDENLSNVFCDLLDELKPDVVHIFGTEYPRTLSMVEATNKMNIPCVISITGMVGPCAMKYYGSVSRTVDYNIVRNLFAKIKGIATLKQGKKDFEQRSVYEIEAIKNCTDVIGRTTWDYACTKQINDKVKYHYCNETLRDTFYSSVWNYKECIPHSIVIPQIGYPIKGFEVFLEGLRIIKKYYPDVKVFIPGWNRFCLKDGVKKHIAIWLSDYDNYLYRLIDKYDLMSNLVFCGSLDERTMCDTMLRANVFVLPSAIENSPNSMGEAMLLGVPTVASCVGGVQDMLLDKKEGYLYPYNEPYMMAHYVMQFFKNMSLCEEFSENARKRAQKLYSQKNNFIMLADIYLEVIKSNFTEKEKRCEI